MEKKEKSFYGGRRRDPGSSFGRRCAMLVREQRAKFYILRRCIIMLVCWREHAEP
ncbi:hypothetical protein J5N97_023515 [Dioscorea zingiberensis]|uniref:Uncharacterized protein n=1 Tax=Dioscorea zingiberensis TaxID=325984 RepID=A0A9D5C5E3_9LILI|nr:hypothetical protein J5N97_023515 [Dioscorea zingiberensis]